MIHYINGVFHSLENETKIYQEMYTDHGVIVGFDDYKPSVIDQTIDLNGAHLYPGFVDSHLHLMGYGQQQLRPSLAYLNEKEMIDVINNHKETIIFEVYRQNLIKKTR